MPSKKRIEADIRDWFENPMKLLTPGAKAEGCAFMGVAVWGRKRRKGRVAYAITSQWDIKRLCGDSIPFSQQPGKGWGPGEAYFVGMARSLDEALHMMFGDAK